VLGALVSAHAHTVPYENIDVLLKRGVRIDIASVQQKLVASGRGGYCFEQNALLAAGLDALGFAVTCLKGRVVRGLPASIVPPSGHQVLCVDLPEGAYIADVGFGNLTPTAPVSLRPWRVCPTPHEPYRLMPYGNEFVLQATWAISGTVFTASHSNRCRRLITRWQIGSPRPVPAVSSSPISSPPSRSRMAA
jgi:N-hydroxyarylamine O-acetyltransferase